MALPGHSPPPPYTGPGSPTRNVLNGHLDTQLPPLYGAHTRTMLPPSPQNYRFPNPPPIPPPSSSLPSLNESRNAPPHKRPSSSMSISSMLGGEPEKSTQEMYHNPIQRGSSRQGSLSGPAPNLFPVMSPPQQVSKPGLGEYSYKPRSQTPDRLVSAYNSTGARQRSSSSGTPLQRSVPIVEPHNRSASAIPAPRYLEQPSSHGYNGIDLSKSEQDDRVRRTSLSGILQRPNSQPQATHVTTQQQDVFRPNAAPTTSSEQQPRPEVHHPDPFQRVGAVSSYDIKPPGSHPVLSSYEFQYNSMTPASPVSPAVQPNGSRRSLASILNGPSAQPTEIGNMAAHRMARQDSAQSHGDQSPFGVRTKFRQYSPFATSLGGSGHNATGNSTDENGRKGSDELSQHRALLGLAAESKRGRYSPMPQVMQGAQAQTPIPDAGVKTEHGRVFSGLGGGIGTTPTPTGSSTKKDDGRSPLSEDNMTKMSRTASGFSKRSRKHQDDDLTRDLEPLGSNRSMSARASKKSKYQHAYKVDLEEGSNQGIPRRGTPLTGIISNRNMSATSNSASADAGVLYQGHQRSLETVPVFKSRKTIKVASVFNAASRLPRKHLGNFTYRPQVAPLDLTKPNLQKFDVSIKPNLIPSFSAAEHVNCTYTIHVPRMWLQERERELICAERFLWGSGIYTDDSDPVAASVHAGFLKAGYGDAVDGGLLSRVVQEQNPKIEWPKQLKFPDQPMDVVPDKDLKITLVVLPLLEKYEGSARFGIKSRAWPERTEKTPHDGVSFGILKLEFVSIGAEEIRIGRTGVSRRERLRMDLEARQRGLQIQRERIARAQHKRLQQLKSKVMPSVSNTKPAPTSVPLSIPNGTNTALVRQVIPAAA